METLRTIEGIDRYLLVAGELLFADLPQIALYAFVVTWPLGWIYGIIAAVVFGFIVKTAFHVHFLGPRIDLKGLVLLLAEIVPGIGALSLLSVAMFVISYFHNKRIENEQERIAAGGAV